MLRLIRSILGLIGIVCLCIALWSVINTHHYLATARIAPGSVVEMMESRDSDGGINYLPRVRYSVDGAAYEITGSISTNPPAYHAGQIVRVTYDRSLPARGRLDGWRENYFVSTICGVIGLVFTAASLSRIAIGQHR